MMQRSWTGRSYRAALLMICCAVAGAGACSSDLPEQPVITPPVPDDGSAVMTVLGASPSSDTVQTQTTMTIRLTQADGTPRKGDLVIFSVVADSVLPTADVKIAADTRFPVYSKIASVYTDSAGVASVLVDYGTKPGAARVRAVAPSFQAVTITRYEATPGAIETLTIGTGDFVLGVGASMQLAPRAFDRLGNSVSPSYTFQATGAGALVNSAGVVTAVQTGFASVVTTAALNGHTVSRTSQFVIPPQASLAWLFVPNVASGGYIFANQLVTGDQTGTSSPVISTPARSPAWKPGTNLIAFGRGGSIILRDMATGAETAISTDTFENWPQFSQDGLWIYFTLTPNSVSRMYRIHPDGTGREALAPQDSGRMPTPSPDGTRIAYAVNQQIKILDLRTGNTSVLATAGPWLGSPRWSPDGKYVAFLRGTAWPNGSLILANLDTGVQTALDVRLQEGFSWSPESQWIIGFDADSHKGKLISPPTGFSWIIPGIGVAPAWKQ